MFPGHFSMISVALTVARHTRLFSFIDRHQLRHPSQIQPHKWSRLETIRNCKFLSSISLYIYPWRFFNITRESNTKSDDCIGQKRRWALFDIGSSRFMSSIIMCDFPSNVGRRLGVIARSAPAQGALGDLATVNFWMFPPAARPISDVYDFPSGCCSWEISKYHRGIISLFSLTPCFSFELNPKCSRHPPALRTTSGRTYHKYLNFSDSECLVLRVFEATTYRRK
jgi:hypothetical protein